MKIISINVAFPTDVSMVGGTKKIRSGYFKKPVSGPIYLGYQGLEGDGVGDKRIHGGKDMAVCVYSIDHFSYWANKLQREIFPGSFAENLSVSGLVETKVNIGDVFEIGGAQVQVSQPRQPCHKLNKVFKVQDIACTVKKTGFSGYYLRVLKPGIVEPDAVIKRIHQGSFSIEMANALLRKGGSTTEQVQKLISLPELSEGWKVMLHKRLKR